MSIFCFKLKDLCGTGGAITKKNMYNSDATPSLVPPLVMTICIIFFKHRLVINYGYYELTRNTYFVRRCFKFTFFLLCKLYLKGVQFFENIKKSLVSSKILDNYYKVILNFYIFY